MHVPFYEPDITEEDIQAVTDALDSGVLTLGPRLEQFEQQIAAMANRRHAIGVSSGTAGLHLALLASNIKAGDEVITTPFSFVASANCILYVGAKPVFVDIDPQTLNLDVDKVAAAITSKTKGIVAVETFGHPGGMTDLEQLSQQHELTLVEDGCEGFGGTWTPQHTGSGVLPERPIGSFGRASVFSFYPNKQITSGEGGLILTDDQNLAKLCRSMRNQGRDEDSPFSHSLLGYNFRLSELHAALGLSQLARLEEILKARRAIAHEYMQRLMASKFLIVPTLADETHMSWFTFVVRLNDLFEPGDRDVVLGELKSQGIASVPYFPPIHLQPYMRERFGFAEGLCPIAEHISARTMALPFFTQMTARQVRHVCDALNEILEKILIARKPRFENR
jgi:perosamine synthetase